MNAFRARLTMTALILLALPPGMRAQSLAPDPVTVTKVATPEKALRFEVTVAGSVDQVWTAFTTKEGLQTWLWSDVRVDARPGGDWIVVFPGSTGGGTIQSLTARKQIVIRALAPEQFPAVREARTTATFTFAAVTPKSTKVVLTQTGWKSGAEWDAAYEYLAKGNASLLAQLHQRFATGPLTWR